MNMIEKDTSCFLCNETLCEMYQLPVMVLVLITYEFFYNHNLLRRQRLRLLHIPIFS